MLKDLKEIRDYIANALSDLQFRDVDIWIQPNHPLAYCRWPWELRDVMNGTEFIRGEKDDWDLDNLLKKVRKVHDEKLVALQDKYKLAMAKKIIELSNTDSGCTANALRTAGFSDEKQRLIGPAAIELANQMASKAPYHIIPDRATPNEPPKGIPLEASPEENDDSPF